VGGTGKGNTDVFRDKQASVPQTSHGLARGSKACVRSKRGATASAMAASCSKQLVKIQFIWRSKRAQCLLQRPAS
jgi:hypothetical protein